MTPREDTCIEVLKRVNTNKLIIFDSLRCLQIGTSGQKSEKKGKSAHDLYDNEQKLEISIPKIETLHPKEIDIDEEIDESSDRNRKYLNKYYQHAQN